MNVLEQINKFVTNARQNNDTVELNKQEISGITCESVDKLTETCQRIRFTVTFSNDGPWGFLKKGKHSYFLDIDTTTLIITDTDLRMKTEAVPDHINLEYKTVRIQSMFTKFNNCVFVFTFSIKKKVPAFTIDVNDFTYKIENKIH